MQKIINTIVRVEKKALGSHLRAMGTSLGLACAPLKRSVELGLTRLLPGPVYAPASPCSLTIRLPLPASLSRRIPRPAGLYVEDTYQNDDICGVAVRRLPEDIQADRTRRIRRALDLSAKHVDLPEELQLYDPFISYGLDKHYNDVVREVAEERVLQTN